MIISLVSQLLGGSGIDLSYSDRPMMEVAEGYRGSGNRERFTVPNSSLQHREFAVISRVARDQPRTRGRFTLPEGSSSLWH